VAPTEVTQGEVAGNAGEYLLQSNLGYGPSSPLATNIVNPYNPNFKNSLEIAFIVALSYLYSDYP
jgi:hypothetical protein